MTEVSEVHENKYKIIQFCSSSTDDDTQSVKMTVTNKTSVRVWVKRKGYQNTDKMRNHNTVTLSLVCIRTSESQSDMKLAISLYPHAKHVFLSIIKCKSILKIAIMYILYFSYFNDIGSLYTSHFITYFIIWTSTLRSI